MKSNINKTSLGALNVLFKTLKRQNDKEQNKPKFNLIMYFDSTKIDYATNVCFGSVFQEFKNEAIENHASKLVIKRVTDQRKVWEIDLDIDFEEDFEED